MILGQLFTKPVIDTFLLKLNLLCNNFFQLKFRFREYIRELRDLELCKSALANAALPLKEIYNKNRLLFELHK